MKIKIKTKDGQQWCHVFEGKNCLFGTNFSLNTSKQEINDWAKNKYEQLKTPTK